MNADLKDLPAKITPLLQKAREYSLFIGILVVLGTYAFLVLRINSFANVEPSQEVVTQQLNELQSPKLDEEAVRKIQELESTNVEIKSLFDRARDNPFQE